MRIYISLDVKRSLVRKDITNLTNQKSVNKYIVKVHGTSLQHGLAHHVNVFITLAKK